MAVGKSGIPAEWPNPWTILAKLPDITVHHTADLPEGMLGLWSPRHRCILIADHLDVVRRRWTLAHELGHVVGGHWWDGDEMMTRALEDEADDWAARRMVPIRLLRPLAREPLRRCASALYLPTEALVTRMRHIHPSEIHVLRRAADERTNE